MDFVVEVDTEVEGEKNWNDIVVMIRLSVDYFRQMQKGKVSRMMKMKKKTIDVQGF